MIDGPSQRQQGNPELAIGYNIHADRLVLPDQRREHEAAINFDYIKEHSQAWPTYLGDKIASNDVTLVGEAHTQVGSEKRAVATMLESARERGLTDVGLELDEAHQPYIDSYLQTGKFVDTDDPSEYDQADRLLELRLAFNADKSPENYRAWRDFEAKHKDNYLFSTGGYTLQEQFGLLRACKEQGLAVHCMDAKAPPPLDDVEDLGAYIAAGEAGRDERMYAKGKDIVKDGGRKLLFIVGAYHVATGAFEHPNAGDLFAADPTVRSTRLFMERDVDHDPDVAMKSFAQQHGENGESLSMNSALYSGLQSAGMSGIGFDLTPNVLVPEGPNLATPPPFDGYIAL